MIPDFDKSVFTFADTLLIILVTRTNNDCIAFWAHLGIIWLLFLIWSHFRVAILFCVRFSISSSQPNLHGGCLFSYATIHPLPGPFLHQIIFDSCTDASLDTDTGAWPHGNSFFFSSYDKRAGGLWMSSHLALFLFYSGTPDQCLL
ncbi:uncharacterized protein BDV14DRAFT_4514 [Aspergillus stella-maris]|uniref:uncharacterized protein n=1 Tax=Aspergillus stella-maris TaxID=1810926 RepID=UPI003CCD54B3